MSDPLILTALMGPADFAWADGLRRAHFPPGRNRVPAHITLFHHLPPALLDELRDRVGRLTAAPPPAARIDGVLHLGEGVAFRVASPGLFDLRDELAEAFRGMLVPQDLAAPRLHITVQNKVSATEARALHRQLSAGFQPRPLRIAGIAAWHYRGGPWEAAFTRAFRG